jgi:hypothetical protein
VEAAAKAEAGQRVAVERSPDRGLQVVLESLGLDPEGKHIFLVNFSQHNISTLI